MASPNALNAAPSPNQFPFAPRPASETFAQYLAAGNICECGPTKPPSRCPIHAFNVYGINQRMVLPSEIAAQAVPGPSVGQSAALFDVTGLRSLRVKHFPWILVPLAVWAAAHFHLLSHLH